jgi:adenylosuccinate lyase
MMAEAAMIALTENGMGRQEAHEVARQAAMQAIADGVHYRDALKATPEVVDLLGEDGIEAAVDPANYTGPVDKIIDAVRLQVADL